MTERAKAIFAATNPPPEVPKVPTEVEKTLPEGIDTATREVEDDAFVPSTVDTPPVQPAAPVAPKVAPRVPYSQRPKTTSK